MQELLRRLAETAAAIHHITTCISGLKQTRSEDVRHNDVEQCVIIIIIICCCCGITFINMDLWLLFAVSLLYAVFLRMIAGRGQLEIVI